MRRADLARVILNPCHIIGRYDTRNWARMFGMIRREAVPGIPRTYGSFCNAEAVAQAHLAAIEHGIREKRSAAGDCCDFRGGSISHCGVGGQAKANP